MSFHSCGRSVGENDPAGTLYIDYLGQHFENGAMARLASLKFPLGALAAITAPAAQYVADAEMLQVRERLTVSLDDSLQRLSPDTRRTVSKNLLEIHESLAQIRSALEQDPQNAFLHQLLHTIYGQELDLLTDINKLAADRPQEIQT